MEGIEPGPESQDAHDDHADRLTELRRDALGADRLVITGEKLQNRYAKLTHPGSGPCVLGQCQRSRGVDRTGFRALARTPAVGPGHHVRWREETTTGVLPRPGARYRHTAIDSPTCAARNWSGGTGYQRPPWSRTQ